MSAGLAAVTFADIASCIKSSEAAAAAADEEVTDSAAASAGPAAEAASFCAAEGPGLLVSAAGARLDTAAALRAAAAAAGVRSKLVGATKRGSLWDLGMVVVILKRPLVATLAKGLRGLRGNLDSPPAAAGGRGLRGDPGSPPTAAGGWGFAAGAAQGLLGGVTGIDAGGHGTGLLAWGAMHTGLRTVVVLTAEGHEAPAQLVRLLRVGLLQVLSESAYKLSNRPSSKLLMAESMLLLLEPPELAVLRLTKVLSEQPSGVAAAAAAAGWVATAAAGAAAWLLPS